LTRYWILGVKKDEGAAF